MEERGETVFVVASRIRADPDLQVRVRESDAAVEEWAKLLQEDDSFDLPPVHAWEAPDGLWLSSGFQRLRAYAAAGRTTIPCVVHRGSRRDALRHALTTNEAHGVPLSQEDRERKVRIVFADPEWSKWSDAEIARHCRVRPAVVRRVREQLVAQEGAAHAAEGKRLVRRNGTEYEMATARIGRKAGGEGREAPPPPAEAEASERPPPTSADEVFDGLGESVPKWLRDAFVGGDFTIARREVRKVGDMLEVISGDHPYVNLDVVISAVQSLEATLEAGRPWCVCPTCRGDRDGLQVCGDCRRSGLWPRWRWEEKFGPRGRK